MEGRISLNLKREVCETTRVRRVAPIVIGMSQEMSLCNVIEQFAVMCGDSI